MQVSILTVKIILAVGFAVGTGVYFTQMFLTCMELILPCKENPYEERRKEFYSRKALKGQYESYQLDKRVMSLRNLRDVA